MASEFRWDIQPFLGLGALRFGMTRDQVSNLLDGTYPVRRSYPAIDGSVNESRTLNCPICSYKYDILFSVDSNSLVPNVFWKELDVYAMDAREMLCMLELANSGAKVGLGFVLFDNIGVNTSGFYDEKDHSFIRPEDEHYRHRGLAVFERGAFDTVAADWKPISFL